LIVQVARIIELSEAEWKELVKMKECGIHVFVEL